MRQERLNELAILNIHKEIPVNIEEVINIISKLSRRIKTEDWSKLFATFIVQLYIFFQIFYS